MIGSELQDHLMEQQEQLQMLQDSVKITEIQKQSFSPRLFTNLVCKFGSHSSVLVLLPFPDIFKQGATRRNAAGQERYEHMGGNGWK